MGWGTCSTASFSAATASSSFDRSCSSSSGAGCTHTGYTPPSPRASLISFWLWRTTSTHSPSSVAPRSDRSASRSALTLRVANQSRQHRFWAVAGGMTATFLSKLLGSCLAFGVYLPNSWRVGFSCSHPSSSVPSPAVGARTASSASSRARMSSFRPVS